MLEEPQGSAAEEGGLEEGAERVAPEHRQFLADVLAGLASCPKRLDSKYFYDERGSALFEEITRLPEYYLTRTELAILHAHGGEMAERIGPDVMLVELGSGSSTKTRVLLDHLETPVAYVPVDVSEKHLLATAKRLRAAYPGLEVLPLVADFTDSFELPETKRPHSHAAVFFPGSTIGNLTPDGASRTLRRIAGILGPGGDLLIGIDLQKDKAVIEAAYNDSRGITDEFNLNLLRRMNRELEADFDLGRFRHKAVYNETMGRIESYLVSTQEQTVTVADREFAFGAAEHVLTEYSHKYTIEGFAELAAEAGFSLDQSWTDPAELFALVHLVS